MAGNFGVGRRPKRRENKDSMENENSASLVPRVLSTMGLSNAAKFRKRHNEEFTPSDKMRSSIHFLVIIGISKISHFYEGLIDLGPS